MAKLRVKVTGVKELQKALDTMADEIYEAMREAAIESAQAVCNTAEANVARDSGELAVSIKTEPYYESRAEGKAKFNVTADADDDKGRDRASFTEIGAPAIGVPAQPFMRPALKKNRSTVRRIFMEKIKAVLK